MMAAKTVTIRSFLRTGKGPGTGEAGPASASHYPASRAVADFNVIGVTKLNIACFNCESTSSAMVTTSSNSLLKSTPCKFRCKVLKMLTCRMRDSSTTMVAV